ncbi:MAG: PAS domain S-box protein, partial [Candidatus Thorarchaeota archaeon]
MNVHLKDANDNLELQLKESEEKFRNITEQPLVGICIVQNNKIEYINKTYATLFGYTVEEMMNWDLKDAFNAIHPEDREFALDQLAKKQRGDKNIVIHYQYRGITKSGKMIWVDQFSKPFIYRGKPANFIIIIDITEKKVAEERIKQTQVEFDTIFNVAGNGIRVIDKDFNVLKMNQAFIDLTGALETESEDLKCYEQFPHPKCHTPECTLNRILQGEEFIDIEVIKRRQDGKEVACILVATPFRNIKGELLGIVEVFKDITKQKQAQKKLVESEKNYRQLIENTLVGVWVINSEYITTLVNSQMAKILGYEIKEMMGKPLFYFMDSNSKELALRDLKIQEDIGLNIEKEFKFLHKNGNFVYTQLRATPIIDEEGNFDGAFAFIVDITNQKRIEQD